MKQRQLGMIEPGFGLSVSQPQNVTYPLWRCQRNLILLFLRYKTLCKTQKKHT